MILRHVTPRRNLDSIRRRGLLLSFAQTSPPAVWLHTRSRTPGLVRHCARRHNVSPDQVAVLTVIVPSHWCRRNRRGLYSVTRDIPPGRIDPVAAGALVTEW